MNKIYIVSRYDVIAQIARCTFAAVFAVVAFKFLLTSTPQAPYQNGEWKIQNVQIETPAHPSAAELDKKLADAHVPPIFSFQTVPFLLGFGH